MKKQRNLSDEEFNDIIKKIDQDNWSLANAVRSVVSAGLHKNEVENIKIKNVLKNDAVVPKIDPFLSKTKKTYSTEPIILDDESKNIIEDQINKLGDKGFNVSGESPLFPNISTKQQYNTKTFGRHFNKYFEDITFDDLRAYGIQRREKQLKEMGISAAQIKEKLRTFSRHSRISTTKKLISGDVQKAGKRKKEELPWERIVKSIENIATLTDKDELSGECKNIHDEISKIEERDVKESLGRLLKEYINRNKISLSKNNGSNCKENRKEVDSTKY